MAIANHGGRGTPFSASGVTIRVLLWMLVAFSVAWLWPAPGRAQSGDQFGGQARADAASRAIVLAVQQGISALPPTSSQSLVYEYNSRTDVFERSEKLGPFSFRVPETIGEGNFSLRAAASYFDLQATLGPIDYQLNFDNPETTPRVEYAKFGTTIDAPVGVFDFTLSYGIIQAVEATLNVPIVLVAATARQIYSADPEQPENVGKLPCLSELNDAIAQKEVILARRSYSELGFRFNDGTHVGVGRISLGGKALIYSGDPFVLAAAADLYFPSPNQDEFAGSNSTAILPRLIGAARLTDWLRFHLDAGYDYDFDVDELRRFVWNVGVSVPLSFATFDTGVGGSTYNSPIVWTPSSTRAATFRGGPQDITVTAIGDNETGTTYVDFLFGAKVRLGDAFVLSGGVNVPVTDEALQPVAAGTVAAEFYF